MLLLFQTLWTPFSLQSKSFPRWTGGTRPRRPGDIVHGYLYVGISCSTQLVGKGEIITTGKVTHRFPAPIVPRKPWNLSFLLLFFFSGRPQK